MNCGNNCGCSITYEELLQYLDSYIANALLCGKLQGGLNACDSTTILPQGTGVVTCSQLKDLINDLIKDGEINIPGIEELKLDGTHLKLTDQAGKTWDVDLDGLLDRTVKDFKLTSEGQILLTLKDGTEFPIDLAGYVAGKVSGARWNSALINSEGKLVFSATDGTTLEVDLSGYVQSETKKVNITGATVGADGKVTLTKGDGTTVEFDIATYVDSQMQTLKNGNIVSGKLDADRNLVLTRADGTTITVDMDPLKKVYVARDSALTGDGTEENPLDIDFSRVCWELFESIHFNDEGLVIQTNTQCEAFVVPLKEFLDTLNNKITVCVSDQGIITGTGKEGNCLGIDLQKLAELLTGDADAWSVIMNAINNSLNVSHDQTLKGSGKPDDKLGVQISPDGGNMLQVRDNGLYYGTVAPADISSLYVSTSLGNDSNAGTRAAPLKTIEAALDIIRERNAPGAYNIHLRAGETFKPTRRVFLTEGTWRLTFTYYDDPLFGDIQARNGYYPEADARLKRPTVIIDTRVDNAENNIVGWTGFWVSSSSAIVFRGCKVQFQQTGAGAITGGGWCWYTQEIQFSGCDVTVNSDHEAIGTAVSILTRQCNFTMNGTTQFFVSDFSPGWVDFTWVLPGATNKDPYGEGPDVIGRPANLRDVVTPANGMAIAAYDTSTKTLFGWSTNWDIFA